ncbi:MAG: FUSC family protein [Siphonobacter sp.]
MKRYMTLKTPQALSEIVSLKKTAFLYAFRILLGGVIAWIVLDLLRIEKKEWALISVAIVSEPDFGDLRRNTISRVINTVTGCAIGIIFLFLVGINLYSLFTAVTFAILFSTLIRKYPSSWKLAPSTVIFIMTPSIMQQVQVEEALHVALLRTAEVLIGCVVALILGLFFSLFQKKVC